jgi:hypothetical protein
LKIEKLKVKALDVLLFREYGMTRFFAINGIKVLFERPSSFHLELKFILFHLNHILDFLKLQMSSFKLGQIEILILFLYC